MGCVSIGCMAALMAAPAAADPAGAPLSTWVPDGEVKSLAVSGQTAYVGGNFSRVAPYTGGSVNLDASTAERRTPWPEVEGVVNAVAPDGSGGWYLGGDFSSVAGVPRQNLAHVRTDGTLDEGWAASTNGIVRALAVRNTLANGSSVFAGGSFTSANGVARDNLAAFEPGTGALQTPAFGVTNASSHFCTGGDSVPGVHTLGLAGSSLNPILYAGGIFDTANAAGTTATRNGLVAFDLSLGTAALTSFDPNMKSGGMSNLLQPVYALAISGDGSKVYVGGCLLSVNGGTVSRSGVARLNASTGAADGAWVPSGCCGSQVSTIALSESRNRVYVAALGLPNSRDVIALNTTDGAADASFDPPLHDTTGSIATIAPTNATVYVGGRFESDAAAPPRENIAAIDAANSTLTGWIPDAPRLVKAIGLSGAEVVAGGTFEVFGGVRRRDLAAIDLTTGLPTAFDPPISDQFAGFTSVDRLAVGDGVIWASGVFSTEPPNDLTRLAGFDPQTGSQTTFALQTNGTVLDVAASGSTVYVGGTFTQIGTASRRNVALLRHVPGDPGEVLRFDADVNGVVKALEPAGDTLYIGGTFDRVNATGVNALRNDLAAVDGETGDVLPFDPNVEDSVDALAMDGGTLFAGGEFATVNGTEARQRLAALDPVTGAVRPWRADADAPVRALELHGDRVFAAGTFTTINGTPRPGIAAIDTASAAVDEWPLDLTPDALSGGPAPAPLFNALAAGPSTGLLAGGDFRLRSPALRAISFAAFRLPPLAPTDVAATAGDAQASVAFTPPAGDGGSPVTSYTVTAAPGGRTASGAAGPLVVDELANGTEHTFTVRALNAVGPGAASAPSNPVTPVAGVDDIDPNLLVFRARRTRFAVGGKPTPATGVLTGAQKRKRKKGTKLIVGLSEPAGVQFDVFRKRSGRKVGGRCVKPTRKNRRRKRCTRLKRSGGFTRTAPAGTSRLAFSGRIRRRALKPGRYRIRATPADAAGNIGRPRAVNFKIVR
jgi:hypothetical protein